MTVTAVISIIAAILFPVFSSTKSSALRTSCLSNFHQVSTSTHLYLVDYDDTFMPVNHQPGRVPNARTDRTWVQVMLPYIGNFSVFQCPSDFTNPGGSVATFDEDLLPGDLFSRYYTASMHVNIGYNFQYLAPILKESGEWISEPKNSSSLPDPSRMLMFVDSVWEVKDGLPVGGGSYLVDPPCRYEKISGSDFDTITASAVSRFDSGSAQQIFAPSAGWQPLADWGPVYGGAWPWHNGLVASTASIDGSVRPLTMAQLGAGCDIRPAWKGQIVDRAHYLWSPN